MPRRVILTAAPGLLGGALPAAGQPFSDWPNRPVRYINGFPPGGPTDTLSRLWCAKMQEITGRQFVVENRSGSGGVVGADAIAKSPPDGHVLGLGGIAAQAIAPGLYPSLPYDPARDFTYISGLWRLPNMLVVNLQLPVHSVPELIDLLRRNPGRYSYASSGPGTTLHLSGELFKRMAGVEIAHVPYRGSAPAMVDVLAGRVHMIFDNIPGALAQARQDKVRALAVTGAERSPAAPDVPTMAEYLPGFEIVSWTCLCGPAGIPREVILRISELSRMALADRGLQRSYLDLGATAWWTSPEDIAAYRMEEAAKLSSLVRLSGARVD